MSPAFPLNCREDGGHLMMIKKKTATDRSDLTIEEAVDFMRLSMADNWGVDDQVAPKCICISLDGQRRSIILGSWRRKKRILICMLSELVTTWSECRSP